MKRPIRRSYSIKTFAKARVLKMNKLVTTCIALALCAVSIRCHASDTSRLFIAQKGRHVAFFLPVFHSPSDIEKDNYLREVIEPVFRRSSVLYDESVQNAHIYPTAITPCLRSVHLPAIKQRRLNEMSAPIVKHDIFSFPLPRILKETDFVKLMLVLLGPVVPDINNLPPNFAITEHQVSTTLARRYAIAHESIETMEDWKAVYCSLNLQEKIRTVDALFADLREVEDFTEPHLSQNYYLILRCIAATVVDDHACYRPPSRHRAGGSLVWRMEAGNTKFILSGRNHIWIEKIEANSRLEGVPFYAFGAAHFLRNSEGPGIFTQLQKSGFHLKRVKSADDIPEGVMASAPLPDAKRDRPTLLTEKN
jgi:hypothetical protein